GGTAADAAVAVSLTLGVTEPFNSGLGGKLVVLYYDAASGKVSYLEALETAPAGMSVEAMRARPAEERKRGYPSSAIPGCVAGLEMMQKKWGKMSWRDLVKPAVGYAREGFPLADKQIVEFQNKFDLVTKDPEAAKIYYPGGKVPTNNAILKNPDLAKTMEEMGENGPRAFYTGEIADRLVAASKKGGGAFAREDFKNYRAREFPRGCHRPPHPEVPRDQGLGQNRLDEPGTGGAGGQGLADHSPDRLLQLWRHAGPTSADRKGFLRGKPVHLGENGARVGPGTASRRSR
ncbi:MAG: hypothetical protein EBT77_08320, partial [Verrucomicrobia bacterium]|nr:hypothetical protein [Verrucomicrobiota bacterium]